MVVSDYNPWYKINIHESILTDSSVNKAVSGKEQRALHSQEFQLVKEEKMKETHVIRPTTQQ